MNAAYLLFPMAASLAAGAGVTVKAERTAHLLVFQEVYLNGAGPFRMAIDTGNASSLIRPAVARRLRLHPAYVVEQATPAGIRRVAAVLLGDVRIGAAVDRSVEAMIADIPLPGVDGVLGQSWLIRHDYLLDYRARRVILDGPPPSDGVKMPLRSSSGVPEIAAEVDGRREELVLDSGAPALILYQGSTLLATIHLATAAGIAKAESSTARVRFAESRPRVMAAIRLAPSRPAVSGRIPGLLPLHVFSRAYVSNRDGVVWLVP